MKREFLYGHTTVSLFVRYKIMNYDRVGVGERLCSTREDSRRANETQGGAAASEGLLYMNYDDAAAPSAVISL